MIDTDVAVIYGVETKRINEAVKNNPNRSPSGYVIELDEKDKNELVENFDRFNRLKHSSTTILTRGITADECEVRGMQKGLLALPVASAEH